VIVILILIALMLVATVFFDRQMGPRSKARGNDSNTVIRELVKLSSIPATPELLELLPSEITDSVFKKIEAEWEKNNPDPMEVERENFRKVIETKNEFITKQAKQISELKQLNRELREANEDYPCTIIRDPLDYPVFNLPPDKNYSEEDLAKFKKEIQW